MPPEASSKSDKKADKQIGSLVCGIRTPGPKYELKTLVGFRGHCLSKFRNPAYSFGGRTPAISACEGPGPKYLIPPLKPAGFTFGLLTKTRGTSCGPGPKYLLSSPKGAGFSLKSRTKPRYATITPGPCYDVRLPIPGPAFSIGQRLGAGKCDPVPGPNPYSDQCVRLRAPMYSLGCKTAKREIGRSPGPRYLLETPKSPPFYSFGTKHSECAPPYIVECDDEC